MTKQGLATLLLLSLWLAGGGTLAWAQQTGFTQEDRERIVRIEATLQVFMEATNQRLVELREDSNLRFAELRADSNQRFAQTDQRFVELREDMNQRFEQVNQRFEQVNQQIAQVMLTMQIVAAVFTAFFLAMLGYAWWDRRTIIRKAKEDTLETLERRAEAKDRAIVEQAATETIRRIEREGRLSDLILALRQHAAAHPAFADDLKAFRLL